MGRDKDILLHSTRVMVRMDLEDLEKQNKEFNKEEAEKILQSYKSLKHPPEFEEVVKELFSVQIRKSIVAEVRKHDNEFSLEVTSNIWNDYKKKGFPAEYDEYVKELFSEQIRKSIVAEVRKHDYDFSLEVTDNIWNDYKNKDFPAEYDESVKELLTDSICAHAVMIISADATKHRPLDLSEDIKKALAAYGSPNELLNTAVDTLSKSKESGVNKDLCPQTLEGHAKKAFAEYFVDYMKKNSKEYDQDKRMEVEFEFRDRWDLDKVDLVKKYLEARNRDLFDAMVERHIYKHYDIDKALGTQNIKFSNIRTVNNKKLEDAHLTDVFCGGDLKTLKESISEMNIEELADHFDTALVELVNSQGYSLNEFAEVYLGGKTTKDPFLNSLSSALKENPDLSQINVYSSLTFKDFDVVTDVIHKRNNITFPKGTQIELSDGKNTSIPIQLKKPYVISAAMVDKVEFEKVSEDNPLRKGFAKEKGKRNMLMFDRGFEKDISKTVNYIEKLENGDKGKDAVKPPKKSYINIGR